MVSDVEMANDEGSDPSTDFEKKRDMTHGGASAGQVSDKDPNKLKKLAQAGRPGLDPDAGSD
jgi:hypothetical protein